MTTDVFEGDFPPANYGNTLAEVEATIPQVIEHVFRDEDGILRSGVNGRTMKPFGTEEVKNRPVVWGHVWLGHSRSGGDARMQR